MHPSQTRETAFNKDEEKHGQREILESRDIRQVPDKRRVEGHSQNRDSLIRDVCTCLACGACGGGAERAALRLTRPASRDAAESPAGSRAAVGGGSHGRRRRRCHALLPHGPSPGRLEEGGGEENRRKEEEAKRVKKALREAGYQHYPWVQAPNGATRRPGSSASATTSASSGARSKRKKRRKMRLPRSSSRFSRAIRTWKSVRCLRLGLQWIHFHTSVRAVKVSAIFFVKSGPRSEVDSPVRCSLRNLARCLVHQWTHVHTSVLVAAGHFPFLRDRGPRIRGRFSCKSCSPGNLTLYEHLVSGSSLRGVWVA